MSIYFINFCFSVNVSGPKIKYESFSTISKHLASFLEDLMKSETRFIFEFTNEICTNSLLGFYFRVG